MNTPTEIGAGAPSKTLDVLRVMENIPHRYPFLLVDRVEILEEGKRAVGRKCVTMNESFFQGHFPGQPIMPGVLIVEAMAQTACALMFDQPAFKGKIAFFMGIEEVKFRKPVGPGDVLRMEVEMLRTGTRAGKAKGIATVDGETATEAVFSFAITEKKGS